jgi:hypothetical protein
VLEDLSKCPKKDEVQNAAVLLGSGPLAVSVFSFRGLDVTTAISDELPASTVLGTTDSLTFLMGFSKFMTGKLGGTGKLMSIS